MAEAPSRSDGRGPAKDVGGDKVVAFTRAYAAPDARHAAFDFQDLVVEHVSDPRYGIALSRCTFEAQPVAVLGDRTLLGRVVAAALEHAADGVTAVRVSVTGDNARLDIDLAGLSAAFGDRMTTMQAVVVRAHNGEIEHQVLSQRSSRIRLTLPLASTR